jgi:hypothetical protein
MMFLQKNKIVKMDMAKLIHPGSPMTIHKNGRRGVVPIENEPETGGWAVPRG